MRPRALPGPRRGRGTRAAPGRDRALSGLAGTAIARRPLDELPLVKPFFWNRAVARVILGIGPTAPPAGPGFGASPHGRATSPLLSPVRAL